jgi:hypothetical protein
MERSMGEVIEKSLNRIIVPLGWIILTDILGRKCFSSRMAWVTCNTEDGTDRLPETSVRSYHYSLRNNPEDRISELLRGGSLKSRAKCLLLRNLIQTKFVANKETFIFSTFLKSSCF